MKTLFVILGILVLLCLIPLGGRIQYDESGILVQILAGPMKVRVFPRKPKKPKTPEQQAEEDEKKARKAAAKKAKKSGNVKAKEESGNKEASQDEAQGKKGGSIRDFLPMVRTALDFLGAFRRRLLVRNLELHLCVATGDPADTALRYGQAWAVVGNLMPTLERWFRIRKRDISVDFDYQEESMTVYADLRITMALGWLMGLGVWYGVRLLIQYFTIRKMKKAVQKE